MHAAEPGGMTNAKTPSVAASIPQKAKPKRDWYPFGGIVASINQQSNAIGLKRKQGVRVIRLDAKTTLEINGKPASLANVAIGYYTHGKLHKDSSGNEVIIAAKFEKEAPVKNKAVANKQAVLPAPPR